MDGLEVGIRLYHEFNAILERRFPLIPTDSYKLLLLAALYRDITRESLIALVTEIYNLYEDFITDVRQDITEIPQRRDMMRDTTILNTILIMLPCELTKLICEFSQMTNSEIITLTKSQITNSLHMGDTDIIVKEEDSTVFYTFLQTDINEDAYLIGVFPYNNCICVYTDLDQSCIIFLNTPDLINKSLIEISKIDKYETLCTQSILTLIYLWRCYTM